MRLLAVIKKHVLKKKKKKLKHTQNNSAVSNNFHLLLFYNIYHDKITPRVNVLDTRQQVAHGFTVFRMIRSCYGSKVVHCHENLWHPQAKHVESGIALEKKKIIILIKYINLKIQVIEVHTYPNMLINCNDRIIEKFLTWDLENKIFNFEILSFILSLILFSVLSCVINVVIYD